MFWTAFLLGLPSSHTTPSFAAQRQGADCASSVFHWRCPQRGGCASFCGDAEQLSTGKEGVEGNAHGETEGRTLADVRSLRAHQALESAAKIEEVLREKRKGKSGCNGAPHKVMLFGVELRPHVVASEREAS